MPCRLIPSGSDHQDVCDASTASFLNALPSLQLRFAFTPSSEKPEKIIVILRLIALLCVGWRGEEGRSRQGNRAKFIKGPAVLFSAPPRPDTGPLPSSGGVISRALCQCVSAELGKHPADDLTWRLYRTAAVAAHADTHSSSLMHSLLNRIEIR